MDEKILAITDNNAPNRRIVEISLRDNREHEWIDIVPECESRIETSVVVADRIFVSYTKDMIHRVIIFDFAGRKMAEMPVALRRNRSNLGDLQRAMNCSSRRSRLPIPLESSDTPPRAMSA